MILSFRRLSLIMLVVLISCKKEKNVDVTKKDTLQKIINSEFKRLELPGIAYLATKADSIVIAGAEGFANVQEGINFTTETRMQVASISKTIIVTAVMQLQEKGMIDLNEDINKYLHFQVNNPKFTSDKITVLMLLTHTSSISDNGYLPSIFYLFGYTDYPETVMSFEKNYLTKNGMYYSKKSYSTSKPGEKYVYSNVGAALLACVVENVTGDNFNAYCKSNIFIPLGMSKTTWLYSETPKNEIAVPYADNNFRNPSKPFYSYPTYPDGHLITTIEDLSKLMRAYLLNGTYKNQQLLKPASVDLILKEYLTFDAINNQGLIFYRHKLGNYQVWGHNGGDPGISTEMFFDKENKIGYIVFNNRSEAYSEVIGNALLTYANQ